MIQRRNSKTKITNSKAAWSVFWAMSFSLLWALKSQPTDWPPEGTTVAFFFSYWRRLSLNKFLILEPDRIFNENIQAW